MVLISKMSIPFTQGCFVPSLVETGTMVLKKIFKLGKCISNIVLLFHLGKGHCPSFEQTWISFIQECFVQSLTETGSLEEDFSNFNIIFSLFHYYLPLEKAMVLYLNKLEFPPPKDALCQVWLKLAQWFWRRWKSGKFTGRWTDRQTDGKP